MTIRVNVNKNQKKASKQQPPKPTRLGAALRAVGGMGGRYLGNLVGLGDAGSGIGRTLGATVSRWLGSGDYAISQNSVMKMSPDGSIPLMHKSDQTVVIRHREFLGELTGSANYTVQRSFPLNPGLSTTFPWLSTIAANFSEYRIKGLVFHYVPTSGYAVSGTNPAIGTVMIQTSYRATESAPTSKVELLNEYWSSESCPADAFCHPIECNPKENPFSVQYVRIGDLPSSENQLMYDLGTTRIATSGMPASNVVGDIWVTYEVELKKPRVTALNSENEHSLEGASSTAIAAGTPFGTNFTETFDTSGGGISVSSTAVTFAAGNTGTWLITANYTGATAIGISGAAVTGSGSTQTSFRASTVSTGLNVVAYVATVRITDPSVTSVWTPTFTTLTGATSMQLFVTNVNALAN